MAGSARGGPAYPNASTAQDCINDHHWVCPPQGCLFDVVADPSEFHEVSAAHPDIAKSLSVRGQSAGRAGRAGGHTHLGKSLCSCGSCDTRPSQSPLLPPHTSTTAHLDTPRPPVVCPLRRSWCGRAVRYGAPRTTTTRSAASQLGSAGAASLARGESSDPRSFGSMARAPSGAMAGQQTDGRPRPMPAACWNPCRSAREGRERRAGHG